MHRKPEETRGTEETRGKPRTMKAQGTPLEPVPAAAPIPEGTALAAVAQPLIQMITATSKMKLL